MVELTVIAGFSSLTWHISSLEFLGVNVSQGKKRLSRRDFARQAALISVAAPLVNAPAVGGAPFSQVSDAQQLPKLPSNFPKLSDQSRTEVEERYQTILKQYGSRLNEEQRADVRRLCFLAQPPLDQLRTYSVQNGDSPALYLKPVVEREKKSVAQDATAKTPPRPAAKKP